MDTKRGLKLAHPLGEWEDEEAESIIIDTFAGRVHVEWNPHAEVTLLGQLPFFINFLKSAELFEPWVQDCPLSYVSPNAPSKRDLLGTILLSVLAGHRRYAHVTTIRSDNAFGNEEMMREAETAGILYLFKLRMTRNVQRLVEKLFYKEEWVDAGQGFEGIESTLKLQGWSRLRRVIVLRRELKGQVALAHRTEEGQQEFEFIRTGEACNKENAIVGPTGIEGIIIISAIHDDDGAWSEG